MIARQSTAEALLEGLSAGKKPKDLQSSLSDLLTLGFKIFAVLDRKTTPTDAGYIIPVRKVPCICAPRQSRRQGSALEARIALDLISRIVTNHCLSSRFLLVKPVAALESSLSVVRVDRGL